MTSVVAGEFAPAQDSLFLTLCGRALDYRAPRSILGDSTADAIVRELGYPVEKQPHARTGMRDIALRAKKIDEIVGRFTARNPDAVVVDLGAGLDSRMIRLRGLSGVDGVDWYDVDLPDVIKLRNQVLTGPANAHAVAADVTDPRWLDGIATDRPAVIVADGLLAFVPEDGFIGLLRRLVDHFPYGEIAFNGYTRFHVWALRHYGGTKAIADAVVNPGFDDPRQPERWDPRLRLTEEILLTRAPEVADYPAALRAWTRLASHSAGLSRRGTTVLRYSFGS